MPALGLPAITGDRDRLARRRRRAARGAVAGAPARGLQVSTDARLEGRGLRRVLVLMGPGTIGLAATQVNVFVNTVLATGEGTGAVSWLNYAFRLMYLPIGLFGVSIATATLPAVSRHAAQDDERRGAPHDRRRPVADADAQRAGHRRPDRAGDADRAASSSSAARSPPPTRPPPPPPLQFYAIGLVGYSIVRIASPVFYALGQNRTPVMVSVATVLANALLNIALVRRDGLPRPGARHVDRRAVQRGAADVLPAPAPRRHRGRRGSPHRSCGSSIASAIMGVAAVAVELAPAVWLPGTGLARPDHPARRDDRRGARRARRRCATCCTSASSARAWRS